MITDKSIIRAPINDKGFLAKNNLYDEKKVKLKQDIGKYNNFRTSQLYFANNFKVSEKTYNKAKDYNEFRDVADAGMVAMASNNALNNKKNKKSLFQQQDSSIFGNV